MSKKLTRLLCLMLSLFMLISSAACKTKEPEDTSSKPTSSKEVESEISGEVESEEDEIDVLMNSPLMSVVIKNENCEDGEYLYMISPVKMVD